MTPPTRWVELYGQAAGSDCTISCIKCGSTLIGDGPTIDIICVDCFQRGVQLSNRVVCIQCATDNGWSGIPTTPDSHPDGFTCDHCGDTH
jgi:hypothetical protein